MAAERVVAQLDAELWDSAWAAASPSLKQTTTQSAWTAMIKSSHAVFGPAQSRHVVGYAFTDGLEGAPPGRYGIVFYSSDFASFAGTEEQVVFKDNSGQWQLAGYWVIKSASVRAN